MLQSYADAKPIEPQQPWKELELPATVILAQDMAVYQNLRFEMGPKVCLAPENAVNLLSNTQGRKALYSEVLGKNIIVILTYMPQNAFKKAKIISLGTVANTFIQNEAEG